jgi:toxin HigB-1
LIATDNQQNKICKRLESIDSASEIEDLRLPGYDLHELKGNRKGTWAIKISGNWRITFRFANGQAEGVDYEDYH